MMLYSEYSRKMTKLAAFLAALRKYKVVIIVVFAVVLAAIAALLGTRGLVYDSVDCPSQIEYGSDFDYSAGAFLGDVVYEYRAVGSDEWTTQKPRRAGAYYVRAVSERTGGAKSYGRVHEFTITPKPVDIAIADSVVFGELPEHSASLVYGDTIKVSKFDYVDVSKTSTLVRADLGFTKAFDVDGNDVTESYDFRTEYGEITFIPREIEITVPDVTGEYDGKPLASSAWELTGGSFADGDGLVTVFDRSQTDVGETVNTPILNVSRSILNGDGIDVTANYRITQKIGKLTVQKREVLVKTESDTHVYDDTPFSCTRYKIADGYSLVGSDRLEIVLAQSVVDAGEVENKILFDVRNADGDDVTYNYSIVVDPGTLTVQKRTVGVRTSDDKKIYDNKPLENRGYVLDGALVDGHELVIESAATLTRAGETLNVLDGRVLTADGKIDRSYNYELVWDYGTLTVDKRKLKIQTPSVDWIYDGSEHCATEIATVPYADTENTGLVDTDIAADDPQAIVVKSATYVKNVLRDKNGVVLDKENIVVIEIQGRQYDYTDNYEIEYVNGALKIKPREIAVSTASHEWMYDGNDHSDNGISVTVGSLANGDKIVGKSITTVNEVMFDGDGNVIDIANTVDVTVVRDGDDVTYNYDISVEKGRLEVAKRYLVLAAKEDKKIYDGKAFISKYDGVAECGGKTVNGIKVGGLLDGHTAITPYREYHIVDAGEISVGIDAQKTVVRDVDGNDVTRFYDIECVDAKLIVSPRPVAVFTGSGEWIYDGEPHFNDAFDILPDGEPMTSMGMLDGHSLKTVEHTEVTDVKRSDDNSVQSVDNELALRVVGTADSNYAISYLFGKLTIKPLSITITTASHTWVYDGTGKSDGAFGVTDGKLVDGHSARGTRFTDPIVDAGSVENDIDVAVETADKKDVTHNYDIEYVFGTWNVTKRTVHIATATETWIYDGKTHSAPTYSTDGNGDDEGFVLGHVLAFTGSTVVCDVMFDDLGNVIGRENMFAECKVTDADGGVTIDGDKTLPDDNYELDITYGTLTVQRRKLTVSAIDTSRVYSGFRKYCDHEISGGSLAEGHTGEPQFDGFGVNVGSYTMKLIGYNVCVDGADVSRNYDISVSDASAALTVTKRPITFVSFGSDDMSDGDWGYDGSGKSLRAFGVETRFVNGQPAPDEGHVFLRNDDGSLRTAHKYVGADWATITDVGYCDNTFTVRIYHDADNTVEITDNYDISYKYGRLAVYERYVVIYAGSAEKMYDGDPLVCHEYTFDGHYYGIVEGHRAEVKFSADSTATDVGRVDNVIESCTVYDAAGKDVTANYRITTHVGRLHVYARNIVVTSDDMQKVYDGKPLVGGGATVNGDDENNDGLADGHVIVWGDPSSITDVVDSGKLNSVEIVKIIDEFGDDVTVNYNIVERYGKLTVRARELLIATASHEWTYDGTTHFDFGYELKDGTLVDGHELKVRDYTKITDVGRVANTVTFFVMRGEIDMSTNYIVMLERGVLSVIDAKDPEPPDVPDIDPYAILRVKSERTASLYLRAYSGGEYNGTTDWGVGNDYTGQAVNYDGANYSVNYLASIAMQKAGMTKFATEIEISDYMTVLPYFTDIGSGHRYTSDVIYTADTNVYSVEQYLYDYVADGGAALVGVDTDIYRSVEAAYRRYVYDTYLSVPRSTAEFMNGVIAAQRFKKDDPAVIAKVARYIRTAAKYDLDYDTAVDRSGDVAVSFLRDYKAGVCRHYATSATMLYRALGIPARYTVGALADAKAGEWVDVMNTSLHAWVELYIDGLGWVNVEVTGSDGNGGGTGDGDGIGGDGNGGDVKQKLCVKPVDVVREYDGTEVFAYQAVEDAPDATEPMLARLLENGYTYTAVVAGSRTNYGVTETAITSFTLFDGTGADVTDKYVIEYLPGSIMITKTQISIHAPTYKCMYDGTPLKFDELFDGVYGYWWDSLPDGVARVTVDMSLYEGITDAGAVTATELTMIFDKLGASTVIADDGEDVSENYTVVFVDGGLTVTPREIVITAGSDEKIYDGTPLVCDRYDITLGSLVAGHALTVVTSGSIVDIGEAVNNVVSVGVVDSDGNDVTGNYYFKVIKGTLTVM